MYEPFKGEPAQITALRKMDPVPALVTLSTGGNDLGFADLLADCVKFPSNTASTDRRRSKNSSMSRCPPS